MITFYFILKKNTLQYIKVTAESEAVAKDVCNFLHPSGFANCSQQMPKYALLFEELKQRKEN